MIRSRSWMTLGVFPAFLVVLTVLPFLFAWSDLPSPMATHWDLGGNPDGSMPPFALLLILVGIGAAVWVAVVRVIQRAPIEAPSFVAGLFAIQGLLAALAWMTMLANRDESTWESADGVGVVEVLLAVAVALILGTVGWFVADRSEGDRAGAAGAAPALDIPVPEHAIWSGRGNGWILQIVGVALIGAGLAVWGAATLFLIAIGLIVLVFAEARVTVSSRGAVISLGWLGFPSWTVPLADIARAGVEDVRPMAYGGWGYRLRPGVRAVVTRGGEGLRLVRDGRADLVVTVDDAGTGAGLINALLGIKAG